MKTCRTCGEDKELDEYYYRKDRDVYRPECKNCLSEKARIYRKENKEKVRDTQYRYTYGISLQEYNELAQEQNNCCAICGIHAKHTHNSKLVVDHDHDTGEVRGLLCSKCNKGIGLLQDNSDFCNSAAEYLKGFNK
jgi:hypothetical protein